MRRRDFLGFAADAPCKDTRIDAGHDAFGLASPLVAQDLPALRIVSDNRGIALSGAVPDALKVANSCCNAHCQHFSPPKTVDKTVSCRSARRFRRAWLRFRLHRPVSATRFPSTPIGPPAPAAITRAHAGPSQ